MGDLRGQGPQVYDSAGSGSDRAAGVITRTGVSGAVPRLAYTTSALAAERRFADGTVARISGAPDPVHGRDRPSLASLEVVRPSGVRSTVTGARNVRRARPPAGERGLVDDLSPQRRGGDAY